MISLLLNINPDPGQGARLAAAIALMKSCGGHITCIQVLAPPSYAIGDPAAVVPVAEAMEAMERAARELQTDIEVTLDKAGVQWTWIREYGDPAATIVSQSRLSDTAILSGSGSYPAVGSVALHARAAVVAVPDGLSELRPENPVVIAWNGSHPCANAMRASLPLLHIATSVLILVIDNDNDEFPAARARDYLSHHGMDAEVHRRSSNGRPLGDEILDFARQFGAGMIVAGAFGHNRIREMLLGGVTRSMLKNSSLPLFLAH